MSKWLKRLGLEAGPPDPDAWTAIATGLRISDPAAGTSDAAAAIIEVLAGAGIEAQQRVYVLPDEVKLTIFGPNADHGPDAADRLRAAVMVHNRDHERATALPEIQQELQPQADAYPFSDDELARQSLQAGEPPPI